MFEMRDVRTLRRLEFRGMLPDEVTDKTPSPSVGRDIGVGTVHQFAVEEQNITGIHVDAHFCGTLWQCRLHRRE